MHIKRWMLGLNLAVWFLIGIPRRHTTESFKPLSESSPLSFSWLLLVHSFLWQIHFTHTHTHTLGNHLNTCPVFYSFKMHGSVAAILAGVSAVLASPAPAPTPAATLDKRDSCTFSGSDGAASASASKASCATITLSALTVPSGTTLDLTELEDGTTVVFEGTTTWEYDEWEGPLFAVSGTKITVKGADGHQLDGQGAKWWDGEGDDGVTKPKFFQAHDLTDSTISGINVLNPPHQVFSINGAQTLTLSDITIDATDGDDNDLGANTDCFDIGSSDGVTITGAVCKNQDDCVAVNSGTNIE